MSQVNGYKGFVGYAVRELSSTEMSTYCINGSSTLWQSNPSIIRNKVNFTSDFMIRTYSSGCYYYDANTGKWTSDGMEIYEDTNLEQTHCSSFHLTSFAGGLVILPSAINFEYVFAHASFIQNPIIYSTVILVTCLYILFAIWARYMDKMDLLKLNITLMADNYPNDAYFYELIVFTGNRSEAGTRSLVRVKLSGQENETGIRVLNEKNRETTLKRSSVDSFIMSVKK